MAQKTCYYCYPSLLQEQASSAKNPHFAEQSIFFSNSSIKKASNKKHSFSWTNYYISNPYLPIHQIQNTKTTPTNTSHILPKYSPHCYRTWAPTNTLYTSPINYFGPQILTIPLPYSATKLYHLYKKPKLIYLVGKTQKAQQNPLQSSFLYDTLTKPVTTRHPKAHYYTTLLQNLLLHGTLTKPVATWHPKARCYTTTLKPVITRHPYKARCYTAPLKPVVTQHPKACCYTTPLKTRCYMASLKPVATRQ